MSFITVKSRRLVARLYALRTRHEKLKGAIETEQNRPMACSFKLQAMKRLRLKMKDEIQALKARIQGRTVA